MKTDFLSEIMQARTEWNDVKLVFYHQCEYISKPENKNSLSNQTVREFCGNRSGKLNKC